MKDQQNFYYQPNNYNNMYYQNQNYGSFNNQKEDWKQASYHDDIEMGREESINSELSIRLGFIRKVFGILSMQMLITTFLCVISVSSSEFALFQRKHPELFFISLIVSIISMILLCCFKSISRTVPTNYLVLAVFTFSEAYLVSFVCGTTSPKLVIMAAAMTCAMTSALTLYAFTTKTDFTVMNSILFICSIVMILFGICLFFTKIKILHIIYSSLGILLYSVYLIFLFFHYL